MTETLLASAQEEVIALRQRVEELEEELLILNPGYLTFGTIELAVDDEESWICIETPSSQLVEDKKETDIPLNVNVPPPPPPPPSLNSKTSRQKFLPKLPTNIIAQTPMRSFFFAPVRMNQLENSVWIKRRAAENTTELINTLDLELVAETFGIKFEPTQAVIATTSPTQRKPATKDALRSHTICLQLGSLRNQGLTHDKIKQALVHLDETVLGDHLDLVQQIVPTNEEIRYVREQIDIDLEFDEAGKFFMQFLRFKDLPDRVRLWAFKRRFEQVTSVLHDQIATISKACAQLLDEKSRFVEFLSLVLTLGNYLNSKPQMSSTPKMHFGFQLSSLTKLKDTKSTDKRTNLLQFLAQWISREHLHLRDFYQDVATVSDAARVPVSVINQEHLRCKRQLSEIRNQLATISQDSLESDSEEALFDKNYYDLMNLFVGKATSTMIEIDRLWEQMKDELKNIALLYCEKEAEIVRDPQAWFLMLDQFVETYKSCLLERRK